MNNHLSSLRQAMKTHHIDCCVIPSNDPHLNEYVAAHYQSRAYFSGFTGSAGTLVVMQDEAALWTDSRYFLQANMQLQDSGIVLMKEGLTSTSSISQWIVQHAKPSEVISLYAELFTIEKALEYADLFSSKSLRLDFVTDLIDEAWDNRPSIPTNPLFLLDEKYAGQSVVSKIANVRKAMSLSSQDVLVVSALDEVAWLLNIRGTDVEYNPVVTAYVIVEQNKVTLFIDRLKIGDKERVFLENNQIETLPYSRINHYLSSLKDKNIWMPSTATNYSLYCVATKNNKIAISTPSPIPLMKSRKNKVEIEGTRLAMQKDGVALVRFYRWLESALLKGERLTELSIADKLRSFRAEQKDFFSESFSTIAAFGPHGAIVHYTADKQSDVEIGPRGLLLIDSGAQFPHGTTDITRTWAVGMPAEDEKRDYTLVLKGHIALVTITFPQGTCGCHLDALAKQFLWSYGLNFGHGTGHGVGHFLCVHEGPQNIRADHNATPLEAGMITSNEPGFYRTDNYGIRLENLILTKNSNAHSGFLEFETLTLSPFDKSLMDVSLLTDKELVWINNYHKTVFEKLQAFLSFDDKQWLADKCSHLKR